VCESPLLSARPSTTTTTTSITTSIITVAVAVDVADPRPRCAHRVRLEEERVKDAYRTRLINALHPHAATLRSMFHLARTLCDVLEVLVTTGESDSHFEAGFSNSLWPLEITFIYQLHWPTARELKRTFINFLLILLPFFQ
jgi:hypothetical protein